MCSFGLEIITCGYCTLTDDFAATGTMQDMLNKKREMEESVRSSKGGLFDSQRSYSSHGGPSNSGINFDNPAVKRALNDLLGSGSYKLPSGSSGRGSLY